MNDNRIVRVKNNELHRVLVYVCTLTDTSYQFTFDCFCSYITGGYVYGDYTEQKLIEYVLLSKRTDVKGGK